MVKWDDSPDQYCSDTGFKVLTKKDVVKLKNLMMAECTNVTLFESIIMYKEEGAKNLSCFDSMTEEVFTCSQVSGPLYAVCRADKNNESKLLLALFVTLGVVVGLILVACIAKVMRKRRNLKVSLNLNF